MARSVTSPSNAERASVLVGMVALLALPFLWVTPGGMPVTKGERDVPPPALPLLAGVALTLGTARPLAQGVRARRWPTARGEVREARPLNALYLYVVCGYPAAGAMRTLELVRWRVGGQKFGVGNPVEVQHDPEDPDRASVRPTVPPLAAAVLATGTVLVGWGVFSVVL